MSYPRSLPVAFLTCTACRDGREHRPWEACVQVDIVTQEERVSWERATAHIGELEAEVRALREALHRARPYVLNAPYEGALDVVAAIDAALKATGDEP